MQPLPRSNVKQLFLPLKGAELSHGEARCPFQGYRAQSQLVDRGVKSHLIDYNSDTFYLLVCDFSSNLDFS